MVMSSAGPETKNDCAGIVTAVSSGFQVFMGIHDTDIQKHRHTDTQAASVYFFNIREVG
jgi:hypothetical protein